MEQAPATAADPVVVVPPRATAPPRATPAPDRRAATADPVATETAPVEAPVSDQPAATPVTAPSPVEPSAELPPQQSGMPDTGSAAEPRDDASGWPWLLGIAAVLVAVGGIAFARKRGRGSDEAEEEETTVIAEPEPPIAAPAIPVASRTSPSASPEVAAPRAPAFLTPASRPATAAAPLDIALVPHRAGMTILEGVVDFSIVVTNRGEARAEHILLSAFLRTAHAQQDAEIAALLGEIPDPRTHNPFALAPGESRRFDAGLTIPKAMIHAVAAGERRVFVPLLVVGARFRSGLTTGKRASAAFLIGRERSGSDRLGPLPFDGEPRMFDRLAARQHVSPAAPPLRMAG
ncbi:hypothetical protein [Sphingomonas japonica]|uniref:hypothetical protein n=1 Tax=Sphingomonas japonica TaxID=511662 RepID=UPI001ABB9B59|nr:hypothetical protein [Sphingomonas japonica]